MKKNHKLALLIGLMGIGVLVLSACTIVITGGARVFYDANNATEGTPPVDTRLYSYGSTATVLDNIGNLQKSGCVFVGWNTNSNGTGMWYYADDSLQIDSFVVILYAQWMPWTAIPGTWNLTYTWDYDIERYAVWTIKSDKTFTDNNGGYGRWDISVNTVELHYSNGTTYTFPYPYAGTNYLGNLKGRNYMYGTMRASAIGTYQPQGDWHAERSTTVYGQSTRSVLEPGTITPSGEVVK